MIDGVWCDIKIPDSQDNKEGKADKCKIFVGGVTENLSKEDLKDHFETFGQVSINHKIRFMKLYLVSR